MKSMYILSLIILLLTSCGLSPNLTPTITTSISPIPSKVPTSTMSSSQSPTATTNIPIFTISGPHLPTVIFHPKPDFHLDLDKFREIGCSPDRYYWWTCQDKSQVSLLGCQKLIPNDLLGALSPSYPIMQCIRYFEQTPAPQELIEHSQILGCMAPVYESYVIFKDNTFQLVYGETEFQTLYAPITSEDEALSYALATTNLYASYDSQFLSDAYPITANRFFTEEVEYTFVKQTTDGYLVHLFEGPLPECSCGPHAYNTVNIIVTTDGKIIRTQTTLVVCHLLIDG